MGSIIWRPVGPAPELDGNVAYSGRVMALDTTTDYDGRGHPAMFLATDGGGVWRATDFTELAPHWIPLTDVISTKPENCIHLSSIQSIAVHPNRPRIVYAGSGAGILRSLDGGNDWSLLPTSPLSARKIVFDARPNGTAVWAGGDFGLMRSEDGIVWNPVSIADYTLSQFSVDDLEWTLSADGQTFTLYVALHDMTTGNAGSRNGIYYTTTAGAQWRENGIDPVDYHDGQRVLPAEFGKITLSADHTPGSNVAPVAAFSRYQLDWTHAKVLNVFKLAQGSWVPIANDLPQDLDTQGGANQPITVTHNGAIYFAVSGNYSRAVFQSLDGGGHWSDITTANGISPHVDHHSLLFAYDALYDANDGGIWRFTPQPLNQPGPGTWEYLNAAGLQTIQVAGVAIHPSDPSIVLIGSQDNGVGLFSQGVWNRVVGGDGGRARFAPGSPNAYAEGYGAFYHSGNVGANWNTISLPQGEFADGVMQNFEVDSFGSGRVIIAGLHGTWLSKDCGASWGKIAPALTGEPNSVIAMCFSIDPNTIHIAFGNGQLFRTTNEGSRGSVADWVDIAAGTDWGGEIVALAADPASADALYLVTKGGTVWRTLNAGAQWENLTADLPGIQLRALTLAPRPKDPYVLVANLSGVYGCWDPSAPRWRRLDAGVPYIDVWDLAYQPGSDMVAAGTYGRGVFIARVGDITPVMWSRPADIVYGTPLGASQLNATDSLPGTFDYTPSPGAILDAGLDQTLSVTFFPSDPLQYGPETATVQINVLRATPTVHWVNPQDIDYGTALDIPQLNATATWVVGGDTVAVPGTFTYTPSAGTVLPVGAQTLNVVFTPTDTANYSSATAAVQLNVLTGHPIITEVTFAPTTLQWNDRVQVTIHVKNDSIMPHVTQGPDPGFEYSEGDTFQTKGYPSVEGSYRIGIGMDPDPYKVEYIYRWGFGRNLAPNGDTVVINGYIRFHNSQHNGQYYAVMICESDQVVQDHQGTTGIVVEHP